MHYQLQEFCPHESATTEKGREQKLPASGCTPFEKDFTRGKQYPKVKTSLKYYHDIFLC